MNCKRLCIVLLSLAALSFLTPTGPVHASARQGDEVIFGDDLTLQEGEQVTGDVVIIGGNLNMRTGSHVEGGVTALGGRVVVAGTVEGDVAALGGDVSLEANARIHGKVIALGGEVRRAPGAQTGEVVQGLTARNLQQWRDLRSPLFSAGIGARPASAIWGGVSALVTALVMALLGVAIITFWPAQTAQVGQTILRAPLPSVGVGCLLYPLAASLTFFALITICLAPLAPVMVLLVVAASLLGWVALGRLFGRWLVRSTGWRDPTPLMVTGIGVFVLTLLMAIAGVIPCLGPLLVLVGASVGLGAVTLSRFGTSPRASRHTPPPA
jgi:hypothetical protein